MLKITISLATVFLLIAFTSGAQPSSVDAETVIMQLYSPDDVAQGWSTYLDQTAHDKTPGKPLVLALKLFQKEGIKSGYAVDLGAGAGKDTLYLLKNHWQVLAIDYAPEAIAIILKRAAQQKFAAPDTQISNFNHMQLPNEIDLVNANLALPFTSPQDFNAVWQNIVQHIRIGGRFCGNFFGADDGYVDDANMTFVTKAQLLDMFKLFTIESLTERHGYYAQANGQLKYWQIWDVVARKIKE